MSLAHDPKFIAITNMPKIGTEPKGTFVLDRFQKTVVMPTYLLAIVVCDFGEKRMVSTSGVNVSKHYDNAVNDSQCRQYEIHIVGGGRGCPLFWFQFGTPL